MRLLSLSPAMMNDFESRVLPPLFEEDGIDVVGAVIDDRPPKTGRQRLMQELKRGRGGYVLVMTAGKLLERKGMPPETSEAFFSKRGVPVHHTSDLALPETVAWIREKRPDVLYRAAFGIIKEPLLSIAPKGVLSYHHGDLRKYRGQPVAFWELFHGESEMRVTVQALNAGLDSGKIVKEVAVPIRPNDSWSSLYRRAYEASELMLRDACRLLQSDEFSALELSRAQLGRLYTTPNLRQWMTLQAKVAVRKFRHLMRG